MSRSGLEGKIRGWGDGEVNVADGDPGLLDLDFNGVGADDGLVNLEADGERRQPRAA